MTLRSTLVALLSTTFLPVCALASVVSLTAPGDFSASATRIDFDDKANYTRANDAYAAQGVTFTRDDGKGIAVLDLSPAPFTTSSPKNVLATITAVFGTEVVDTGATDLNLLFSAGATEVGAYFGNDLLEEYLVMTLSLFDSTDTLIGSESWDGNGNLNVDQFVGLRSDVTFYRARFSVNVPSRAVLLDDVTFTSAQVPEPSTLALIGLSLAALSWTSIRRRRTA